MPPLQMQTLTRMDMIVIDDCYHVIPFDDMNWIKLTQILLSCFSLNLGPPFKHFTSLQNY